MAIQIDQHITVTVLACALSAIMIPILIRVAMRFEILSMVDFRRKTTKRIPLLGGVAIYLSTAILSVAFKIDSFYGLLICFFPLLIVGVWDDKVQLTAKIKALLQVAAVCLWAWWVPTESLLLAKIGLPPSIALPLTVFWIMGLINALNMIDGIDMAAGGFSVIAFFAFALFSSDPNLTFGCLVMAGSICGFLIFNRPPAKIYLGECGSTLLGFSLGVIGSTLPLSHYSPSSVLIPLYVLAFPEMDALISMYRRWKSSNSLFRGDHDHIHHKLKKLGLNIHQALLILFGVSIYCCLTAYVNLHLDGHKMVYAVNLLAIIGLLAVLGAVYYLEHRQTHQVSSYSKTILHKYINFSENPTVKSSDFHAVIYDLFPYYQELQMRGFSDVNDFVRSFSEFINKNHPNTNLYLLGSYTIISIGPYSENLSTTKDFFSLTTKYYNLLDQFQVTKGDGIIPNGMAIYSSKFRPQEFMRKYGVKSYQVTKKVSRKKAS